MEPIWSWPSSSWAAALCGVSRALWAGIIAAVWALVLAACSDSCEDASDAAAAQEGECSGKNADQRAWAVQRRFIGIQQLHYWQAHLVLS